MKKNYAVFVGVILVSVLVGLIYGTMFCKKPVHLMPLKLSLYLRRWEMCY